MNLQNQLDYLPSLLDGVNVVPTGIDANILKSEIMLECGLLTPLYSEPAVMKAAIAQWFAARSWTFDHLIKIIAAEYSPIENYDRKEDYTKNTANIRDVSEVLSGTDQRDITEKLSGMDRHDITETLSGTDQRDTTETLSNSDTTTRSVEGDLTTEQEVSAYNSSSYVDSQKSTVTDGQEITTETEYGKTTTTDDDVTYGKKTTTDDDISYGKTTTTDDDVTYGKTTTTDDDSQGLENLHSYIHGNIGVTTNQQMIEQELALLAEFNIYNWIAKQFSADLMLQLY